jgi:hypothetical protein
MNRRDEHPAPSAPAAAEPLARLALREDVLQICFWFRGEGLGERYDAAMLRPLLPFDQAMIDAALHELVARGDLERLADGRFGFSAQGRHEAGRLFADAFADFQQQGHGECAAGCCDGDDHSRCGDECSLHAPGGAAP